MRNFSLFVDKNGTPKQIEKVNYRDIKKLLTLDIHEGYYVDFKKEYNVYHPNAQVAKKAKADLCDDICSFANCDGGWIIFGIEENDDKEFIDSPITKVPRLDYNQQISEILKNSNCFPVPYFETKFIKLPQDTQYGYLVIHIFEGLTPPYVSNGKIKTRVGSSSKAIDISNRHSLDFLYQKSEKFKKNNDDFCKREIYFRPTYEDRFQQKFQTPMINVYVKSNINRELVYYKDIEKLAETLCSNDIFRGFYYTTKSIILYNAEVDLTKTSTLMAEFYYDFSLKIHIPLPNFDDADKNKIIQKFPSKYANYDFDSYYFANGIMITNIILKVFELYNSVLDTQKINLSNGLITVKFENTQNSILVFNNRNYFNFININGLHQCLLSESTHSAKLKDYVNNNKINGFTILCQMILMQFGYLLTDIQNYNLFDLSNADKP